MQNKARVTPRNIQFKDSVQIREIPSRNVDDTAANRRESWDPNLSEVRIRLCFFPSSHETNHLQFKEVFAKQKPTKQRNVVIIIAICGLVLVGVVVGVALGVILNQKSESNTRLLVENVGGISSDDRGGSIIELQRGVHDRIQSM